MSSLSFINKPAEVLLGAWGYCMLVSLQELGVWWGARNPIPKLGAWDGWSQWRNRSPHTGEQVCIWGTYNRL